MTKDRFVEFFQYINGVDFKAEVKCITPKVPICATRISVELYTKSNDYADYGDYTHKDFKKEFKELLIDDEFIDKKNNPLEAVEDIRKWKVWLNLSDGDSIYAGVHLFDYSEEGLKVVGEAANYK